MRTRAAVVVVVGFLALAGCGSGGGSDGAAQDPETGTEAEAGAETAAMPVAVEADSLLPEGTALADGVEVQPGSSLVGSVFPLVDPYRLEGAAELEPRGWQAVFVVHGDPVEVWDGYADALGIGDRANAIEACTVEQIPPPDYGYSQPPARFLTEPAMDDEDRLVCRARLEGVEMNLIVGTTPCVIQATGESCPDRWTSHLQIAVDHEATPEDLAYEQLGTDELRDVRANPGDVGGATDEATAGQGERVEVEPESTSDDPDELDGSGTSTTRQPPDVRAEPAEIPVGPVVAPELGEPLADGSRLPKAGERIDDDLDDFLGTEDFLAGPALLPDGGRSLVAPAMLIDCNSGLIAVMEVPGTPAEAVRSFEPQKVDRYPEFLFEGTTDDVDWAQFMYDSAGGFYLLTTAVATGDGTSLVLGRECGD